MRVCSDLADAVGKTPLIRLARASEATGCEILGKAEFLNPGQSVKDRAALYMIRDAVARGELEPGGTIVEGTAGNTGIGLALVGASLGSCVIGVEPQRSRHRQRIVHDHVIAGEGGAVQRTPSRLGSAERHLPHARRRAVDELAEQRLRQAADHPGAGMADRASEVEDMVRAQPSP